jgi:hypothetical protein
MIVTIAADSDMAQYNGRLRGACLMRTAARVVADEFTAPARRWDADSLIALSTQVMANRPNAPQPQGPRANAQQNFQAQQQFNARLYTWFQQQGVVAMLNPSGWGFGMLLTGGSAQSRQARDSANFEPLPALTVSVEHYGQIWRDIGRGIPVRLELNSRTGSPTPTGASTTWWARFPAPTWPLSWS